MKQLSLLIVVFSCIGCAANPMISEGVAEHTGTREDVARDIYAAIKNC
jgi:hypothetical protein